MAYGGGFDGDELDLVSKLTRHDFPPDFCWGGATSTYQVDGAYLDDKKSLSNWDAWTLQKPGKVSDSSNGCVALDHYNRFKDDIKLMKKLGIDCYRFSISWSRILPGGRLSGGVNQKGIKFYNDLIDALLDEGITPWATLFHFDLPQCLLNEYGAFEDRKIVQDFGEYADVCFFQFGDRVKHWVTLNEPWSYTFNGYVMGSFPPGHSSSEVQEHATDKMAALPRCIQLLLDATFVASDHSTEPYVVAHHLLLAHAKAVDIYRRKYQAVQSGKIGIVNNSAWYEPYANSPNDVPDPANQAAAYRAVDFYWGWFSEPVVTGDYPPIMRERLKKRLPIFTPEETKMLKGSFDFLGLNYYTTYLAENDPKPPPANSSYFTDQGLNMRFNYGDGTPVGQQAGSTWLYIVPRGIYGLLKYIAKKYNNPLIYITENGVNEKNDGKLNIAQAIQDDYRIDYHRDHLINVKKAIHEGVNVKGYMVWSLFDNFEWSEGYTVRFGLYYVDFANDLARYPKNSAIWYMNFLNKKRLTRLREIDLEEDEEHITSAKKKRARTTTIPLLNHHK